MNRPWINGIAALLVLGLSLALTGCGPEIEPGVAYLGKPIINGDPDTSAAHMAVVYIYNTAGYACTGTLIAPTVVLTAAHCCFHPSTGAQQPANTFIIGFGYADDDLTDTRNVSEVHPHTNFSFSTLTNDIAILRLSSTAPSSVTPIPALPSSLAVTSADIGTALTFVGFGETETGGFGTKLWVNNALDFICTSSGGCTFGGWYPAAQNTICYDESPGGPCSGDSGGPAFLTRSGTEYVAGITSYGDQNCDYYGCSTKVDAFGSFIATYVSGPDGTPCGNDTECDHNHCEDGVCCATACPGECQACNLTNHVGVCTTVPNNTVCGDNNVCNGADTCQNGTCVAGAAPNCNDNNACTTDSCNPTSGCVHTNNTNACNDGSACTTNDACSNGSCTGTTVNCNDSNPCTNDSCDPASGCVHTNNSAACNDGNPCTANDRCSAGVCTGTTSSCDDGNLCTTDSCNPSTGACTYTPITGACNDGNACTTGDTCASGACVGTAIQCDDGNVCNGVESCNPATGCTAGTALSCADTNPCTDDSCNPATGCAHTNNTAACDDGNPCTLGDHCANGACQGGAANCDDGNPCTSDSCVGGTGCQNVPNTASCDDHDPCTISDTCAAGACSGTPRDCSNLDGACTTGACDPADGQCHAVVRSDGSACDDGDPCTSGDVCNGGSCVGAVASCDDGNACTTDACNPATGACSHQPLGAGSACNDGDACTTGDTCDAAGTCSGAELDCSSLTGPCAVGACDPSLGQCLAQLRPDGTPCDNGDPCTAFDTCQAGNCVAGQDTCGDGGGCGCAASGDTPAAGSLGLLLLGLLAFGRRRRA